MLVNHKYLVDVANLLPDIEESYQLPDDNIRQQLDWALKDPDLKHFTINTPNDEKLSPKQLLDFYFTKSTNIIITPVYTVKADM